MLTAKYFYREEINSQGAQAQRRVLRNMIACRVSVRSREFHEGRFLDGWQAHACGSLFKLQGLGQRRVRIICAAECRLYSRADDWAQDMHP